MDDVTVRVGWLERPSAERLDPDRPDYQRCLAAHRAALAVGAPGYADPTTGLFVMSARYLRDRGWCCDRGCRHCPYVGAGIAAGTGTGADGNDQESEQA